MGKARRLATLARMRIRASGVALAELNRMPSGARVHIIRPADGQTISGGKWSIRMGRSKAGIAPARAEKQRTGLAPGRHTLQLLMSDADQVPHEPSLRSRRITIDVRPSAAARLS